LVNSHRPTHRKGQISPGKPYLPFVSTDSEPAGHVSTPAALVPSEISSPDQLGPPDTSIPPIQVAIFLTTVISLMVAVLWLEHQRSLLPLLSTTR
jgi:hypothetical protein